MVGRSTWNSLLLLLVVIVVGVFGYVWIEGWSVSDAAWMVFITLTTIGYGEPYALSHAGRLFTVVLIGSGLGVGTYALSQFGRALVEGDLAKALYARRRKRMLVDLDNHFIVIGYGRLGRVVARELHQGGHRLCVIESDAKDAGLSPGSEDFPVIVGDGADDDILREAGIERARGVAVTAAPVAQAIYITLSCRQLNPSVPILCRVEGDADTIKARRAGATQVVSPPAMGGWRMALGLVRPHTTTLLDLATLAEHEEVMLDEVQVHRDCRWVDHTIKEMQVGERHGVLIVGIRRIDGQLTATPSGATQIGAGDIVIVLGAPEEVRKFTATLARR